MINFKQAFLAGYCTIDEINEFIEEWHLCKPNIELHEFLGLTFEEYRVWAETGKIIWLNH